MGSAHVTGTDHPGEEDLVLFFYGEKDAGTVARHVEGCDACQARLQGLARTLAVVDGHRVPERDSGYGAQVWARVQEQLERRPSRPWLAWFAPSRLAWASGLALLFVAAFIAGRYSSSTPVRQAAGKAPGGPDRPVITPVAGDVVRDRVLLVAVGDHLERSQVVLVELMNRPAEGPVDISAAQEWARDLVPTNRLMRQTADEAGERVMADVLDDLERTLVEIANGPSQLSRTEFEQVRERIDGDGLVFKIRVLDSQVREREKVSVRPL